MIDAAIPALFAAAGAFTFRLRGAAWFAEWTGRGATTARLVYSGLLAAMCWATWAPAPAALAVWVGLYLGTVAGWWRSLSLGLRPADAPVDGAFPRHALRGLLFTAPAAVLLALLEGYTADPGLYERAALLLTAGLTCVPAYTAGWALRPEGSGKSPGATEIGEYLFGAAIGAALAP